MSCAINNENVLRGIERDISQRLLVTGKVYESDGVYFKTSESADISTEIVSINKSYGRTVVKENGAMLTIDSNGVLGDVMSEYEADSTYSKMIDRLTKPKTTFSTRQNVSYKINKLLEDMGVTVEELSRPGMSADINAIALPLQSLVQYAKGQEGVLLEEALHIAVELMSVKHPGLLNNMMAAIPKDVYQGVYEQYSTLPAYQKNGQPDVLKIKKEAVAKMLVSEYNSKENRSLLQKLKDFLSNLFGKSDVNLTPFRDSLQLIFRGDIGTVRNTLLTNRSYLSKKGLNADTIDEIVELAQSDISDVELRMRMEQIAPEEAFYSVARTDAEIISSIKSSTATPSTKDFMQFVYDKLLNIYGGDTAAFKKSFEEFKNQRTSPVGKSIDDILKRWVDTDGNLRTTPLGGPSTTLSVADYNVLEASVLGSLNRHPSAKFLVNQTIPTTEGNVSVSIVAIENGTVHMYDFFSRDADSFDVRWQSLLDRKSSAIRKYLLDNHKLRKFGASRLTPVAVDSSGNLRSTFVADTFSETAFSSEETGDKNLDSLLMSFTNIMNNPRRTVSENRLAGQVARAIRDIRVKGDITNMRYVVSSLNKRMGAMITTYESKFKGTPASSLSKEDITEYANELEHMLYISSVLSKDIAAVIKEAADNNPAIFTSTSDKDIAALSRVLGTATSRRSELNSVNRDFTDRFFAEANGIEKILDAEASVSSTVKNIYSISQATTKATQLLYKIFSNISSKSEVKALETVAKMEGLRKEYSAKYGSLKDFLQPIAQKSSSGKYVHKLISKYDRSLFHKDMEDAISRGVATTWVVSAVDTVAYGNWYRNARAKAFAEYDQSVYSSDKAVNDAIIQQRKDSWEDRFDITKNVDPDNTVLDRYVSDKYLSNEYRTMEPVAKKLYDMIYDLNMQAYRSGAMSYDQAQEQIPSVTKNYLEKLVQGGKMGNNSLMSTLFTSEEMEVMNDIDPSTGRRREKIPFRFIQDYSTETSSGDRDYSSNSQDIFRLVGPYAKEVYKFGMLKEQEAHIRLLGAVERGKQSIAVDKFGNALSGTVRNATNDQNAQYYDNFVRTMIYGHRDLDNTTDTKIVNNINNLGNKAIDFLNNNLGTSFDKMEENSVISGKSVVEFVNKAFQLKVLGLNIVIPFVNFVGSNIQGFINDDRYFTRGDFFKNELKFFTNSFASEEEKAKYYGVVNFFGLMYDSEGLRDTAAKLSQSKAQTRSIPEWLMSVQSASEKPLQMAVAISMLDNTIVVGDQLVNIRKHVESKYPDIFEKTESERADINRKIEDEIKTLKEKSVLKTIVIDKDGVPQIPGISRDSDTVQDFIRTSQAVTRKMTGGGNRETYRQINGSLLGRSVMVFKSWMPQMIMNRVSKMRYDQGLDRYEYGRYNALLGLMGKGVVGKLRAAYDVAMLNNDGIELLKEQFENEKHEYSQRTGSELKMSEAEFMRMYSNLMKATARDTLAMITLTLAVLAYSQMEPPEDKESKNMYYLMYSVLHKIKGELGFYYNPESVVSTFTGNIFPSAAVIKDGISIMNETLKKVSAVVRQDEEDMEKGKLLKAVTKPIPVVNQALPYLGLMFGEYAASLGFEYKDPTNIRR